MCKTSSSGAVTPPPAVPRSAHALPLAINARAHRAAARRSRFRKPAEQKRCPDPATHVKRIRTCGDSLGESDDRDACAPDAPGDNCTLHIRTAG